MTESTKRGLKRLLIVSVLVWFGFWSYVALRAQNGIKSSSARLDNLVANPSLDPGTLDHLTTVHLQAGLAAERNFTIAIICIVTPLIALGLFGVSHWIWRGFKPKT